MYDTIKLVQKLENLPLKVVEESKVSFEWGNLLWKPKLDKLGCPVSYYSEIENLYLTIKGDELAINNSLHKFYLGNNYDSFSYTQVVKAFEKLDNLLPFSIYNAKVKKIAMGTVINQDANEVLDTWMNKLSKEPIKMLSKNKSYGLKYYLTDYNVKGYNKTTEVKDHNRIPLDRQLFRFEVEVKKVSNLNNGKNAIGIYTVQDLLDPTKYQKLANYLTDKYNKISKKPSINLNETTVKEKRLIALFKDMEIIKSIKKQHSESYKKDRKKYNSLMGRINNESFQNTIFTKLNNQIQYSINN